MKNPQNILKFALGKKISFGITIAVWVYHAKLKDFFLKRLESTEKFVPSWERART